MHFNLLGNQHRYKKLPRPVRDYMTHRFSLLPEYLDTLRCFEYIGLFNGKQVKYLDIFSPHFAYEHNLMIKDNQDLKEHPEMLFYRGHIDSQGGIYVTDRRVPLKRLKVS